MVYFEEQHVCIRFCCKLGKNATETLEVLKVVYEVQTVQEYKFFMWFSLFKSSVTTVEDGKCSEYPSTTEQIKMWVEGRQLSSRAEESLGVKLPTFWELHSGHFRVFLKTV